MKFLTLLSSALLFSASVSAQRLGGNHNEEAGPYNTGFGFKGGVNIASVYGLPSGGLTSEGITSFHLGPYAKLGITDAVAIQLEALYSRRGANFEFEGLDEKSEIRLDYIDVPLLFVYNIVGENTWSFMVGPQASLLLTVKDGDKEIDKAQDYNSFDFSGVAGVQFGYKFLRVGARYNVGFLDVLKEQDGATDIGDGNYKNHFGQVYVGVEF